MVAIMSVIYARRTQLHSATAKPCLVLIAFALVVVLAHIITHLSPSSASAPSNANCVVSHGTYTGAIYAKPDETLENVCLVESPWMRVARHSVRRAPPSEGGDGEHAQVIDDWLWIDYHDRVNVLVEAPPRAAHATAGDAPAFLILAQTKYALEGASLAVVGGIIDPGEEALGAAQREVGEELGVACRRWQALGRRFRTDVNRGMGWVHPYLARDCTYSVDHPPDNERSNKEEISAEVGGLDTEQQHVQIMQLSEVKKAVMDGQFVEVQWSNTVALAMLHLSSPPSLAEGSG